MAWYWAVVRESGGKKAVELERMFSPTQRMNPSCIWFKYKNGLSAPRDGTRKDGKPHLVGLVAQTYPNTKIWWSCPLWRLLDTRPLEMKEIRQAYEWLPYELKRSILSNPDTQIATSKFWRKHEIGDLDDVLLQEAARRNDISGITAVVALLREAETSQQKAIFRRRSSQTKQIITEQFEMVFIGIPKPKGHLKLLAEILHSLDHISK